MNEIACRKLDCNQRQGQNQLFNIENHYNSMDVSVKLIIGNKQKAIRNSQDTMNSTTTTTTNHDSELM